MVWLGEQASLPLAILPPGVTSLCSCRPNHFQVHSSCPQLFLDCSSQSHSHCPSPAPSYYPDQNLASNARLSPHPGGPSSSASPRELVSSRCPAEVEWGNTCPLLFLLSVCGMVFSSAVPFHHEHPHGSVCPNCLPSLGSVILPGMEGSYRLAIHRQGDV